MPGVFYWMSFGCIVFVFVFCYVFVVLRNAFSVYSVKLILTKKIKQF